MAASSDEASPVLTGVLLQIDGNRLTLAATDRHRLAVKTIDVTVHGTPPVTSVIVPSRHLAEVARAVNPNRPTVGIAFAHARNQVFFTLKDVEISSRLIEGTYPNYTQVIPGESTTTVSLSTASLLREAKTAAVLARDAANPVRLRIGDGTLTLLAQTAEVGDDEAPAHGDRARVTTCRSRSTRGTCWTRCRRSTPTRCILSFNGSLQPGVIRPVGKRRLPLHHHAGAGRLDGCASRPRASHRRETDPAHEVLTDAPVERGDDSRGIHLQLMRESRVRCRDEQHTAIEPLGTAQRGARPAPTTSASARRRRSSRTCPRTPRPRSAGSMRSERRSSVTRARPA